MSLKLHLGCGDVSLDGYINIDARYLPNVDKVENAQFLRSYSEGSVDVIYACAILEHFTRWEYVGVLQRWNDLLRPGGILRISVPDFEALTNYYKKCGDIRKLIGMFYGGQDYKENFHHMCWDFNMLKEDLENVGFKDIHKYDWRNTEHSNVDDFSQSYLPHMDKENGQLMHLNVEATK